MTDSIPYAGSRDLLEVNIRMYQEAITDPDECGCRIDSMKDRLAALQTALRDLDEQA